MLQVENVTAGYGAGAVLTDLTLTVNGGDRVAILGRNGVGKTTLLRCMIGEISPRTGVIKLGDRDITREPAHRRARMGIAYVPQGRDIFPGLSVMDNLKVAAYGVRHKAWADVLTDVLDEFPILRQKAKLAGGGLSGGQQQILALGRALMTQPKVLLLDEPSEGIQPSIVDQIADHVRRINELRGITVVLVEQNLEFATNIAEHAYLMDKGQIVRELPAKDVLTDRDLQHEYLGV
ncbi:MAG: ABC transporter ATP-binding protein [Nocardioidaceae bacterium]|nr:ABC transporter ATP-binding protein [Nocardioidaceae bacterium]